MRHTRETLINNLSKENFIDNYDGFQRFCYINLDNLNKHPIPFFSKELSKVKMK